MESVESKQGKVKRRPAAANARAAATRPLQDPRSRMCAAMLELVGEQGYPSTTVADVIGRAGASRKTFYEHFEDREACFLAVADEVAVRWIDRAGEAAEAAQQESEPAQATVGELFAAALAEPSGLRVLATELAAAGRVGVERRERAISQIGAILAQTLSRNGDRQALSESLTVRASAGALVRMAYARVFRGGRVKRPRRADLLSLVPEAASWLCSYREASEPPVRPLPPAGPPPPGGRAPGTLSLSSRASERRGLPRGESTVSRSFVVHSQRERLLDALANLSAAKGYEAVTIPEIVTEAAVSVQAFYEHFSGREDALLVSFELGHRKALALVERAYEAHEDWREAVEAALGVLLAFLASEPSFAHLALVDVPAAGAKPYTLARDALRPYSELLRPGLDYGLDGRAPSLAPEASASAVQELCYFYTARERARELSTLTDVVSHIALTPFGAEPAR
jgi:AcrR family transcriptional regulator